MAENEHVSAPSLGPPAEPEVRPAPGGPPADSSRPGSPLADWPDELTGRVVSAVGWLRARVTLKLTRILVVLAYGLVAVVGAVGATFFLLVAVVRIWDSYVPIDPAGRRAWLAYVVLGGPLFLSGAWLWSRGRERNG